MDWEESNGRTSPYDRPHRREIDRSSQGYYDDRDASQGCYQDYTSRREDSSRQDAARQDAARQQYGATTRRSAYSDDAQQSYPRQRVNMSSRGEATTDQRYADYRQADDQQYRSNRHLSAYDQQSHSRDSYTRESSTQRRSVSRGSDAYSARQGTGMGGFKLPEIFSYSFRVGNYNIPIAYIALAAALLVLILIVGSVISSCSSNSGTTTTEQVDTVQTEEATVEVDAESTEAATDLPVIKAETRISFVAFGDNLMNENLLSIADSWGGNGTGDGVYEFSPYYRYLLPAIQAADIAFVNQETTMCDPEEWDYSGYPSYNTPESVAKALADAGFDVVNMNSNHTYDYWADSIVYSQQIWRKYPQLTVIGTYSDDDDRANVRVVTSKGIKIAFLSYSYGQNGYDQEDLPNDYYAVPWDYDKFLVDYQRARAAADVVVVYMHGGTEYVNYADDWQWEVARTCANTGVDLVIGSHAHVIQPMAWIDRADGSGKMLTVFGMGDMIAGYQHYPDTIYSGQFNCDIVIGNDGAVSIENPTWTPLVEHMYYDVNGNLDDYVIPISQYTPEMAYNNILLAELDTDQWNWVHDKATQVIGSDFTIIM